MKYLFFVQGEGRGHMTQAISLRNTLVKNGHEVIAVVVGKSLRREIPSFFKKKIAERIVQLESPNFLVDKKNKKVQLAKSIFYNVYHVRRYIKSIKKINSLIKETKPDIVINFYDLLAGLYFLLYNPKIPFYCIGHQYLLLHPGFTFPPNHKMDKFLLFINTKITSFRADKLLALSFRKMNNIPEKGIIVVPPLLRKSVLELKPLNQDYIHGYILNEGYATDIVSWHISNQDVKLDFFWDKNGANEETKIHRNLTFHKINDGKFLDYMSRCKAYATTAGFESICEAMYLGKPVMMIPTEGHFEQKCNALDASLTGAGIISDRFDLSKLIDYIPNHKWDNSAFKDWVNHADGLITYYLVFARKRQILRYSRVENSHLQK